MSTKDPMIGRVLHGTIQITRLLGRGGMGNVYEAMQTHLERKVAVKVMTPEHAANPMAADYFLREAKQASRIRHPNIIQVIDFGKDGDDVLFLAMEYVPGKPLTAVMKEDSPLPPARIIEILSQTMDGLGEAHSQNLVHRDLKPDNLMIEKTRDGGDFVKILDFGISQTKGSNIEMGPLTQAGALVGTPQYMSPEQARGEAVDHRSDLFSMGVILYEMLTGIKPFNGKHVPQILMAVIQNNPPPPSVACPEREILPELETICLRALNKSADLRYQTASEFRNALQRIGSQAPKAEPAPAAAFIFKRSKKDSTRPEGPAPKVPPEVAKSLEPAGSSDFEDALNTINLGQLKAPDTQDIAAENNQPARPRETVREPDMALAGTEIAHGPGLGHGASEVVDTSKLFDAQDVAPVPEARSRFGIDAAQLRRDLVGEKRIVTAVVSHHRTTGHLSSEELATHLTVYQSALVQVAQRWGGAFHSRQGTYATILFGVERTSPDDGFRATQAALDLRAQLRRLMPKEFGFGFGISQGEIFMQGGELAQATGHALDNASDAARGAGDDEVLIEGDLEQQLEATFKLGAPTRSGARPVLGVLDVSQQPVSRTSNLVGRDEELAAGLAALASVGRGSSAMFVVTGHAGMGKTALLREIESFAEQRGHLILRANSRAPGVEGLRDTLLQWLKDLAWIQGRTRDADIMFREFGLPPETTRILAGFMDASMGAIFGARGTERSFDSATSALAAVEVAFRALLKKIQQTRAIVLTLDQLDAFDAIHYAWYQRWARQLADDKVLWLLGIRVRSHHESHDLPESATSVYLDALDEAATKLLLKAELPQDVSNNLRVELANISAGVPLQLRQLIDYVKRHKMTSREQAEEWLAQARQVNAVLQMRLFDLQTHERNLLALLSVLGNGTLGEVLFDLASDDWQPEAAIQNLYVEGVIDISGSEEEPVLSFKPPVFERVVHDRLSDSARRQIHGRAVDYFLDRISTVTDPNKRRVFELAAVKHLLQCERQRDAVEILDRIAGSSIVGFEYELAESYLARAVSILEGIGADSVAIARLNLRRVRTMAALGDNKAARDLCRLMDRDTSLPEDLSAEIKIEQGFLWLKEEDPDVIINAAKRAVAGVRHLVQTRRDDYTVALLVRGLQLLGEILQRQGRFAPAVETLLEAVELVERHDLTANNPWGPRLLWEPVNQLARVRLLNREFQGAGSLLDVALRVVQEVQDPRGEMSVRANYAVLFAEQGRMDAAVRSAQAALKLAVSVNDLYAQARMLFNLATMHLRQRRRDLAEENFKASLEISESLDWREGIAMNTSQLTSLAAEATPDFMKPRG
ncbi:MAG: protein kinase [bacterium]